jgi:hypothetical protein
LINGDHTIMNRFVTCFLLAAVAIVTVASVGYAQSGADAKARGRYDFYGKSAQRSMRSARDYSRDYRQHVQAVPQKKVDPVVAKDAADAVGTCLAKAQKDVAQLRKDVGDDKDAIASLDVVGEKLAAAAKHHKEMAEHCCKPTVDGEASMECCEKIDEALEAALGEHEKLMKKLGASESVPAKK